MLKILGLQSWSTKIVKRWEVSVDVDKVLGYTIMIYKDCKKREVSVHVEILGLQSSLNNDHKEREKH